MYLNPTLNMWVPCIPTNNHTTAQLLCGEVRPEDNIFGTSTIVTHSNCTYRVYYIKKKIT